MIVTVLRFDYMGLGDPRDSGTLKWWGYILRLRWVRSGYPKVLSTLLHFPASTAAHLIVAEPEIH